jgi:hypothetical protein
MPQKTYLVIKFVESLFGQEKALFGQEKALFGHKILGISPYKSPFVGKALFGHEILRITSNRYKARYLVLNRESFEHCKLIKCDLLS